MLLCLVIDTLPCPGTNFPRQKDSLQPARQKWSEKDSGTYNWRKVHPSKLAWLNLNFSIISDSIKTPLIAIEATPHPHTMADLVAEGGGSRQKGIHILKVSARGTVASPNYSAAILKKELFSQSCTAMSASTLARKGRRMDIRIRYFLFSSIRLTSYNHSYASGLYTWSHFEMRTCRRTWRRCGKIIANCLTM